MDLKRKVIAILFFAIVIIVGILLLQGVAFASGQAQPIVELASSGSGNVTFASKFPGQKISGTNTTTKQAYKFQRQREGKNFSYTIFNLSPSTNYSVELSFVEHDYSSSGKRIFNVYLQGTKVLPALDIYSRAGGKNTAYQRTFLAVTDSEGRLIVWFRSDESGCKDYATISTIRIYQGTIDVMEIDAHASRNDMGLPVRFENSSSQNAYEVLLSRLGSRFNLNLLPQRLYARMSTLGHGTGDLEELVMALKYNSEVRALPFTDRFPVWENIVQSQTMTTVQFDCSSSAIPFELTVKFRAPFYPGEEKVSSAPFIYMDVTVKNTGSVSAGGTFMLAKPSKQIFAESSVTEFTTGSESGLTYKTYYHYADETMSDKDQRIATEGLCVPASEATDVDWRGSQEAEFNDYDGDTLWGWESPSGYPKTKSEVKYPVYSFYPRGYTGALWTTGDILPGSEVTKHFVFGGYTPDIVMRVNNVSYSDSTYRFRYTKDFSGLTDVFSYAVSNRASGDDLEGKSDFFDQTICSDSYFLLTSSYATQVRNLIAYTFQSFLTNTWWTESDYGREWWSVWEGTSCRFHSTVDVEYNNSWFYFQFWPGLLKKTIEEWVLYKKSNSQGTYLSHDMGAVDYAGGQVYEHDMPVEENANFTLLLYKYWKTTGDKEFMEQNFSTVKEFVNFLINCDTNNNGLPDQNTGNTLDQSTFALQSSQDQAYLGVKCLGAYIAAGEMSQSLSSPDLDFIDKCRSQAELINQTLAYELWREDHYAVSLDFGADEEDREAYHIYTENGLLLPMSASANPLLYAVNRENMKKDLSEATHRTLKEYGCTHSTYDAYNEWVSQNIWRDSAACLFGVALEKGNPLSLSRLYWEAEKYFAKYLNGGYWDVVLYPGWDQGAGNKCLSKSERFPGIKTQRSASGEKGVGGGDSGGSVNYDQSLGYYPRGAASLGLIDAVAGLRLDIPSGVLWYKPTTFPLRVPIFARADWNNPDPTKRIPVLYFQNSSSPPVIENANLLPSKVREMKVLDILGLSAGEHALSPDGDGTNDETTIRYTLQTGSNVRTSIWDGAQRVKEFGPVNRSVGEKSFTWDGKDDSGLPVRDGFYTARIDARPFDSNYVTDPASTKVFVNNSIPNLSKIWYLAEGYTGWNETGGEFEEYILIQNPTDVEANVTVTFMLPGGETRTRSYRIPAESRFTISVDSILPAAEVSAKVTSDVVIAVERAMYFNGRRAGHDSIGITKPSEEWYLAEGYTGEDFDEYVLIQNPSDEDASVKCEFLTSAGKKVTKNYSVQEHSRFTIHVDDFLPNDEVSTTITSSKPVVVERAQYLNWMKAGTCSIAARSASRDWYLSEGYTAEGFETWVLIENPQDEYNNVLVTFMDNSGNTTIKHYRINPLSRFTISVDQILEASEVSVSVRSEYPVLVERAMYWNERSDGHATIGTPTPDKAWYFPEGYTADGFETWVLVQNPNDVIANVQMTFMTNNGTKVEKNYTVNPKRRFTVNVGEIVPDSQVSTYVKADVFIVAERSVYFNGRSGGTNTVGIRGIW